MQLSSQGISGIPSIHLRWVGRPRWATRAGGQLSKKERSGGSYINGEPSVVLETRARSLMQEHKHGTRYHHTSSDDPVRGQASPLRPVSGSLLTQIPNVEEFCKNPAEYAPSYRIQRNVHDSLARGRRATHHAHDLRKPSVLPVTAPQGPHRLSGLRPSLKDKVVPLPQSRDYFGVIHSAFPHESWQCSPNILRVL